MCAHWQKIWIKTHVIKRHLGSVTSARNAPDVTSACVDGACDWDWMLMRRNKGFSHMLCLCTDQQQWQQTSQGQKCATLQTRVPVKKQIRGEQRPRLNRSVWGQVQKTRVVFTHINNVKCYRSCILLFLFFITWMSGIEIYETLLLMKMKPFRIYFCMCKTILILASCFIPL